MSSAQVSEGYKQTEIGMIPDDWEALTLEHITSLIIDGTHHTPQYINYGVPFLRVTDVQSSIIDLEKLKFISLEEHQFLKRRCSPEAGDLLLSKNGTIGLTKVIDWDWEFSVFVSLALIKIKKKKLDIYYLDQIFKSGIIFDQLTKRAKQGAVTNLHLEEIRELIIPLPPLPEQRAIAQALSDVDALIASLDKLIAKQHQLKTAAMQQLLTGKMRLPGFGEGKGYKQTEVGVIPEDWEILKLKDIAPLQRGFDLPTSLLQKGDYPVVYSNGVMNHHAKFMVNGPGVVTGRSGTIGNVHYVSENYWPHNTALWVTAFIGSHPKYIYYLYKSLKLEQFGTGSGVPTLNRNDVHDSEVAIPELEEQRAISTVLSDMDTAIAALEARRAKTQAIKQGMMQELLTGRTRLV